MKVRAIRSIIKLNKKQVLQLKGSKHEFTLAQKNTKIMKISRKCEKQLIHNSLTLNGIEHHSQSSSAQSNFFHSLHFSLFH